MPIYEYQCKKCGEKFDKLVRSMNDDSTPIACAKCGSTQTTRALSLFAVGAENTGKSAPAAGCGRCGGPNPCSMDD
jgi:putative FmdB family regulatory protein